MVWHHFFWIPRLPWPWTKLNKSRKDENTARKTLENQNDPRKNDDRPRKIQSSWGNTKWDSGKPIPPGPSCSENHNIFCAHIWFCQIIPPPIKSFRPSHPQKHDNSNPNVVALVANCTLQDRCPTLLRAFVVPSWYPHCLAPKTFNLLLYLTELAKHINLPLFNSFVSKWRGARAMIKYVQQSETNLTPKELIPLPTLAFSKSFGASVHSKRCQAYTPRPWSILMFVSGLEPELWAMRLVIYSLIGSSACTLQRVCCPT